MDGHDSIFKNVSINNIKNFLLFMIALVNLYEAYCTLKGGDSGNE